MASQDDFIRTALRVPPDLHAKIHEAAKGANRTFNAEIVARLELSFGEKLSSVDDAVKNLNEATEQLKELFAHTFVYDSEDKIISVMFTGMPARAVPVQVYPMPENEASDAPTPKRRMKYKRDPDKE
jgi:hypothetical protein